jgi:NAD+ synthase (glutamine-hydrolysing)
VLVLPELGLTGYTVDDLLQQDALLDAVEAAIAVLAQESKTLSPLFVVGAPLRDNGRLYNTAVAIQGGRVRAVIPKSFLPNYREFYERRWFTPGSGVVGRTLDLAGQAVPFGTDILLRNLGGGDAPSRSASRSARTSGRRRRPAPPRPWAGPRSC